jgi:hypothetical protein
MLSDFIVSARASNAPITATGMENSPGEQLLDISHNRTGRAPHRLGKYCHGIVSVLPPQFCRAGGLNNPRKLLQRNELSFSVHKRKVFNVALG